MSNSSENLEKLLDPSAKKAFLELANDLRQTLYEEALKTSCGSVTEDDLLLAHKRLNFPSKDARRFNDAQEVISQAFRENRVIEWLSYVMAVILFVFGLVLLSIGVANSDASTRIGCMISGSIVELLILIPFRFAINSRRHNMAMRMLGLIINRVDDPKKLAPLLKDTFLNVVLGKASFKNSHD